MLVQSRRIKMFVFVILLLQFPGAQSRDLLLSFTDKDEVTLPCENVISNHQNCDTTTWIFTNSTSSPAVELVNLGQVKEKANSDRLSVTADCSLVIKKVTDKDVGRYICRQFSRISGKQKGQDAVVHLSVVVMTEQKDADQVTLSCSVRTYERCKHRVKWIHKGEDLDEDDSDIKTSQSSCSATVTFLNHNTHISSHDFKCSVRIDNNKEDKKVQLFPFSARSSGEDAKQSTSITTTSATTTLDGKQAANGPPVWPYIVAVVLLVALLIIAVKIMRLKRLKGRKTKGNAGMNSNPAVTPCTPENSQETAEPEDGVSYASISFTKNPHSENKGKHDDDDDEGETVTYSTVNAASTEPSSL